MRILLILAFFSFQFVFITFAQEPDVVGSILTSDVPQSETESDERFFNGTNKPGNQKEEENAVHVARRKREMTITNNDGPINRLLEFIRQNVHIIVKYFLPDRIRIDPENIEVREFLSLVEVRTTKKDKVLLRTGSFYVYNYANSVVESSSQSYAYTSTHTESISVTQTFGLSGSIKFPLPIINDLAPTVTFSKAQTTTKSDTITESVTIPSQKVVLNPKSKIKLSYNLYREELVHEYHATFLVDQKSTFFLMQSYVLAYHDINIMLYLKLLHEKNRAMNIPGVEYNYEKQELLIKNHPVTRTVISDVAEMVFGAEESL